jgi:hypothetical protein
VLEQHRDAAQAAAFQRAGKRAGHHHVARGVQFAEQAGVTFDRAVRLDRGARAEDVQGELFVR